MNEIASGKTPRDGNETDCGVDDFAVGELRCTSVMAEVWPFLDGECPDEVAAQLCRHLADCAHCMDQYALEARVKKLIATKCRGESGWPR